MCEETKDRADERRQIKARRSVIICSAARCFFGFQRQHPPAGVPAESQSPTLQEMLIGQTAAGASYRSNQAFISHLVPRDHADQNAAADPPATVQSGPFCLQHEREPGEEEGRRGVDAAD
ncbi:unnamed protein product [Pleuronectes platessa]|uniref:Uncharacterized protein n=1 Tax=Pleuronectes platessa TaxID=8262 RepID=A0A9N7ZE62_PLEPL|nr:unnamed protein product [Pleuronectes platessa]